MLQNLLYTYITLSYIIVISSIIICPFVNPQFRYLHRIIKAKHTINACIIFAPITVILLFSALIGFILFSMLKEIFPEKLFKNHNKK